MPAGTIKTVVLALINVLLTANYIGDKGAMAISELLKKNTIIEGVGLTSMFTPHSPGEAMLGSICSIAS